MRIHHSQGGWFPVAVVSPEFWRVLAALMLLAISFGYVETAVVVYLRALYEPIQQRLDPHRAPDDLFPLITLDQLEAEGPIHPRWLTIEVIREGATLVLLSGAALAVARNFRQWFAAFLVTFGFWDIFYYLFLKVLLDWPSSLLQWDLLFLLPVPWVAPVLAPVLVALSMIGAGIVVLRREYAGRPIQLRWRHWVPIIIGGLILVAAFCWDFRNITDGNRPNPFNWLLFFVGEGAGLAGFFYALGTPQSSHKDASYRRGE